MFTVFVLALFAAIFWAVSTLGLSVPDNPQQILVRIKISTGIGLVSAIFWGILALADPIFLLVAAIFGMWVLVLSVGFYYGLYSQALKKYRTDHVLCLTCGYDLKTLEIRRCPECGPT